jgi:hypothetical protein
MKKTVWPGKHKIFSLQPFAENVSYPVELSQIKMSFFQKQNSKVKQVLSGIGSSGRGGYKERVYVGG